jgi:hypothetical protein
MKHSWIGFSLGLLASLFVHQGAWAASSRDLDSVLVQLRAQLPAFELKVNVSKTFSRAFISNESGSPLLTIDPDFMSDLTRDALLFVVAHEYAHVHFNHQKKLGAKAIELAGLPNSDMAFDALETQPLAMAQLHQINRQFELDADEAAVKWLKAMGVEACTDDVLRTMDNNEMAMMVVSPSHPGFYRRKAVICRAP